MIWHYHLPPLRQCRAARCAPLLVLVALAGCVSSGSGSGKADPAPGTSPMVMDDPSSPGLRRYLIHPPAAGLSATSVPLLVVLHGGGSDAAAIEKASGFSAVADRERFVVVYPEATGRGANRTWNAGFCCGTAAEEEVDDAGFVLRVVDHVAERLPVNRNRVYLVGYSEGGMLAHRIAVEETTELAGLAVVAGAIGVRVPGEEEPRALRRPRMPLPVMIMHGLADKVVHYWERDAGQGVAFVDVVTSVQLWTAGNGCGVTPLLRDERGGALLVRSFKGQAPVEVVVLEGWGHEWPGRRATDQLPEGSPLRGFDAAEVIWEFLAARTRGETAAE